MFFFLVFGTLILRLFGIPLSMVRIVGGIILVRLGFSLFSASSPGSPIGTASGPVGADEDVAFVPLAMPIMFGPGAIATILGMISLVKQSAFEVAAFAEISAAIVATMLVTYLVLRAAKLVLNMAPEGSMQPHASSVFLFPPWAWDWSFMAQLKPSSHTASWFHTNRPACDLADSGLLSRRSYAQDWWACSPIA